MRTFRFKFKNGHTQTEVGGRWKDLTCEEKRKHLQHIILYAQDQLEYQYKILEEEVREGYGER